MNLPGAIQIVIFAILLTALVKPLGNFMAKVFQGERVWLTPVLGPMEHGIYRLCGIDAGSETSWQRYALAVLLFNLIGLLAVYVIQLAQGVLPLNPQGFAGVEAKSAFNTAVSFVSNTNWQGYGGESTLSYFTQMLALTVQNFLSAASGMAVLVALIRGFARRQAQQIGNFYVDMTRGTLYVLLPLSLLLALVLVSQGVVQNFSEYKTAELVEPLTIQTPAKEPVTQQTIPLGPAASQIAIKQLGTNGGGFFNVNSAHPFENPTPLTNFLEVLAILLIPAALCYTFGRMVKDTRQGWAVYAAMMIIFLPLALGVFSAEQAGNPRFDALGVDQVSTETHSGGNMEGKEARFGIASSALWAAATTAASNGSVNSMHDSYTPLGGLVPMWLMQLGEVVFGGAGSGLYGMLMFAIVAVFIAGLMVGRTPEYLGKKIEAYEVKMASLVLLVPCVVVLIGTAIGSAIPAGTGSVANPGAHGFSEILYAFSSAGNNNGSAFGGLSANTPFYNIALGVAMWISRFWLMIPVLAIAGSLAAKRHVAITAGTLPTHTPLFVAMLIGVVLMVGALTFLPSLALGPIVEHLQMIGKG
ncbi:potassium-transporting ATPase subunit KdpA [Steroidobacter cummioxidans]|uniref:potassium-transporting ATPase subunit KdpA n=1 Tax=Steroidobacter cummioxidans TaxID=1803913 RepID=UPI000E30CAB1|nr:potassium-transporting ATPase subunit KdpA [Steroidobacter cummioxidans]